jgi:hypothetical protein
MSWSWVQQRVATTTTTRRRNSNSSKKEQQQQQQGGSAVRRRSGERRCCTTNLDLRWGAELQRFKNEEGRREGDKGHTRIIPGEGGREAGMKGGAASCPTTWCCPGELQEEPALIYSHPLFSLHGNVYFCLWSVWAAKVALVLGITVCCQRVSWTVPLL